MDKNLKIRGFVENYVEHVSFFSGNFKSQPNFSLFHSFNSILIIFKHRYIYASTHTIQDVVFINIR